MPQKGDFGLGREISARQAAAWSFCALSVPAALRCTQFGWGWVLLGCSLAAVIFFLGGELTRGEAGDLTQMTCYALGETVGRTVLGLGGAFTLLALAQTAGRAGAAFDDETGRLAAPAVLALSALANRKGAQVAARVCSVAALVLAVLYGIVIWSAVRQVEAQWLVSWGSARQSAKVLPMMLVLGCIRYLPGRTQRPGGGAIAGLILIPAVFAAITSGCLSPLLAQRLDRPFYTVSQSLRLFDVMERFEPLVSSALLMGFFALASLLLAAAKAQLAAAMRMQENGWLAWALAGGAYAAKYLTGQLRAEGWAFGAAIFWGMIPLLTQLIVAIKKD